MMSSGVGVCRSALVMLLVSLGAAVEVFNAGNPEEPMPAYDQAPIEFVTGNGPENMFMSEENPFDLMLPQYGGFPHQQQHLQKIRISLNGLSGHIATRFLQDPEPMEVNKRLPSAAVRAQPVRPQQKWKIKKGKALGAQIVCYFKLCAFRSPH